MSNRSDKKLGVPCLQGLGLQDLEQKAKILARYLAKQRIDPGSVVYCGNGAVRELCDLLISQLTK